MPHSFHSVKLSTTAMHKDNFYTRFTEYYPDIFPFSQETYTFLKKYTRPGYKKILDAGCGTGDYAARFQKDGFQAAGFDLDENMIEYALSRFPETEFFQMDLREISGLKQNYPVIYSIGNTVSHLPQAEFISFAGDVFQMLHPGGRWIFQVKNWDHILEQAPEYHFPVIKSRSGRIKFFRRYESISSRQVTFITRLEDKGRVAFQGKVQLYPIQNEDYLSIHHRMGFDLSGHFADFSKTPYEKSRDSANIFVFTKPSE